MHPRDADFAVLNAHFPPDHGARQMDDLRVQLHQSSCSYAVPYYEHRGDRDTLAKWSQAKGPDGIEATWTRDTQQSIDGLPTYILEPPHA